MTSAEAREEGSVQPRGGRGGRAFLPCPHPAKGRGTSDPEIPGAPPQQPLLGRPP